MRILLLTHYYPPEMGAPQLRWSNLVAGFTAAGHEVGVFTPIPHYPHARASQLGSQPVRPFTWESGTHGERVLRMPYLPTSASMPGQLLDQGRSSWACARTAGALDRARPDVVISTTPGLPMLFAGRSVARRLGVPHIAEIRDAWPDLISDLGLVSSASRRLLPARVTKRMEHRTLPRLFHRAMRSADHVVVTTHGFAERLRQSDISPVSVIRNAAVPRHPAHCARRRGAGDELRLLYVGTVGRSQNLELLVRAVAGTPGVSLTIVGAGADRDRLRDLAAELGAAADGPTSNVAPAIRFLPQTTGPALEALWEWADSGIVSLADAPSFEHTVPSKLYGLMARGVHITGILAGEAAALIESTGAGHCAAPGDGQGVRMLLAELRDGKRSLQPSPQARDWISAHADPAVAVRRYLEIAEAVR